MHINEMFKLKHRTFKLHTLKHLNLTDVDDNYLYNLFDAIFRVSEDYICRSDINMTTERTFCYELYHQWAKILEEHSKYRLRGEEGIYLLKNKKTCYTNLTLHESDEIQKPLKVTVDVKRYSVDLSYEDIRKEFVKLYQLITCESNLSKEGCLYGVSVLVCSPEECEKAKEIMTDGIKYFLANQSKENYPYLFGIIYSGTWKLQYIQPDGNYVEITKDNFYMKEIDHNKYNN